MVKKIIKSIQKNSEKEEDLASLVKYVNKGINTKTRRLLKKLNIKLFNENKAKNIVHTFVFLYINKNIETLSISERLINDECFDEAFCLMRMALERSAITVKVLVERLEAKEIEKITGSQCVSSLKKHFKIGKLYGMLSKYSHSLAIPALYSYLLNFLTKDKIDIKSINNNNRNTLSKIFLFYLREINFCTLNLLCNDYFPAESKWCIDDNGVLQPLISPPPTHGKTFADDLFFLYRLEERGKKA